MNNVINKFFLSVVLLPAGLYDKLGVNLHHLRAILKAKLMMDDRRPNTFQQARRKKDKVSSRATVFTMVFSAILGAFYLVAFTVGNDYVTHLTLYFSMYIFMLASILISDFTSVLIDIRDNDIILPKPVNDRTVVVARLLHILIHVCKIVLPMSLGGIILVSSLTSIAGGLLFLLFVLLATLFTIFLINALYILILKITTPEKFQRIISNFQIVFAILIYAAYQLIPRMIGRAHLEGFDISSKPAIWLAPSFWFAKAWNGIMTLNSSAPNIAAIALAIVAPVASVFVVVKYFAPSFNQKLALINSSNPEAVTPGAKKIKSTTPAYVNAAANWFNKKGAERMSFLFSWKMTGRSKEFRMKVYPSIGYMIVIVIIPFITSNNFSFESFQHNISKLQYMMVFGIYFSSFLLMIAVGQLFYSDKYKAAWIFYSAPVSNPGELISGAVKAAIMKFYLPLALLFSIAGLTFIGVAFVPNMLLAFFNELLICFIIMYLSAEELPFSMQQSTNVKTGSLIRTIFMFIIPAVLGFLHFLVMKFTIVVCILAGLSVIATWLVHDSIRRISWQKIKGKYQD